MACACARTCFHGPTGGRRSREPAAASRPDPAWKCCVSPAAQQPGEAGQSILSHQALLLGGGPVHFVMLADRRALVFNNVIGHRLLLEGRAGVGFMVRSREYHFGPAAARNPSALRPWWKRWKRQRTASGKRSRAGALCTTWFLARPTLQTWVHLKEWCRLGEMETGGPALSRFVGRGSAAWQNSAAARVGLVGLREAVTGDRWQPTWVADVG